MYFLIQLMSLYMPPNSPPQVEPLVSPLFWKVGFPSLNDLKQRAQETLKKSADDLLNKTQTNDSSSTGTSENSTTAGQSSGADNAAINRPGKLVTTSPEIIPIVLPMYQGLPISNTWYSTTGVAIEDPVTMGQINIQRWLVLMQLASESKLLDNNRSAMMTAAANLPGEKWPEYFNCGSRLPPCEADVKAINGQPAFGRAVPTWKGTNAAEWDAAHKAFADRYGKLLVGQAAALPQDMYMVTNAILKPYSAAKGGLPISSSGFLDGVARADDPQRRLKLAANFAAAVPNRLPQALQCAPSQCEAILDAIPGRQEMLKKKAISQAYPVYLLVKTRVKSIQGSQNLVVVETGYVSAGQPNSEATIVDDIAVYADKALSKRIYQFDSQARKSASLP